MTAINTLASKAGAYLMTDTATYVESGVLMGFQQKATAQPHLNLAFALTGTMENHERIAQILSPFTSTPDVIARLPEVLRDKWADGEFETYGQKDDHFDHFRLFVAVWNEVSSSGELYVLTSLPGDDDKRPPFTWWLGNSLLLTPRVTVEELHEMKVLHQGALAMPPAAALTRIIDLQRGRTSADPCGENEGYFVGGHAVLTSVGPSGITQTIVRRWNDEIGSLIQPVKSEAEVDAGEGATSRDAAPGMNRHERRAFEADQRRSRLKVVN